MQLFYLLYQRETNSLFHRSVWLQRVTAGLWALLHPATGGDPNHCEVFSIRSQHRRAHPWCHVICRYYQSTKSSGLSSNLQPTGAKADHLREEMEEAANRMEICRVSHQLQSRHISPYFGFCRWNINISHLSSKLEVLLIDIGLC